MRAHSSLARSISAVSSLCFGWNASACIYALNPFGLGEPCHPVGIVALVSRVICSVSRLSKVRFQVRKENSLTLSYTFLFKKITKLRGIHSSLMVGLATLPPDPATAWNQRERGDRGRIRFIFCV